MILHPSVLSLLFASVLSSLLLLRAAWFAGQVLRGWDLASGSERQLRLERGTYLVSTLLACVFGFELLSLFFFVSTADALCTQITGAMCAAGTLAANVWGYPALAVKILTSLLAGVWLVLNAADNRAPDYPLIRAKYRFLLALTPLLLAGTVLQGAYFLGLRADIITSCCGSLFSVGGPGVSSELAALPPGPTAAAFFSLAALTIAAGLRVVLRDRGARLFGALSAALLPAAALALISFVSIYLYELPTHHCPFCILRPEYHRVGYLFYLGALGGGISGTAAGLLDLFRGRASLGGILPPARRRLALAGCLFWALFAAVAAWGMLRTDFSP